LAKGSYWAKHKEQIFGTEQRDAVFALDVRGLLLEGLGELRPGLVAPVQIEEATAHRARLGGVREGGKDLAQERARVVGRPGLHVRVGEAHADRAGRIVSFIQSNYYGFGSGVVVPGTGIALQNRGAGFTLEENHPNQVGPRKRPFHTIIPGFVTAADGFPLMSFGGVRQTNFQVQATQWMNSLSQAMNLPILQKHLGDLDTWTIDANPANFIVANVRDKNGKVVDHVLKWIDPFFPPAVDKILANPKLLD
jgi:hypothetical protein